MPAAAVWEGTALGQRALRKGALLLSIRRGVFLLSIIGESVGGEGVRQSRDEFESTLGEGPARLDQIGIHAIAELLVGEPAYWMPRSLATRSSSPPLRNANC